MAILQIKGLLLILALLSIWPWSSGQKTYQLAGSSIVPAATATVKVQKDKVNHNTKLDIKVRNLARPASLTPPARVYLVWAEPRGGTPARLGEIGVNKHLNAELKTVTVFTDFELLITAEQSETATMPSGIQIFHTYISTS
ncbi:MAG TPA: hypothetical protein VF283_01725 [Bryobacteraceae bacterium]